MALQGLERRSRGAGTPPAAGAIREGFLARLESERVDCGQAPTH